MIAGDHPPSRLQCQYECVNLVCTVKTENPESCVGLMTMSVNPEKSCAPRTRTPSSATPLQQILKDGAAFSYDCPTVHITPTGNTEPGPILTALHKINKRPCHMCEFEDAMEVHSALPIVARTRRAVLRVSRGALPAVFVRLS
jgi:hypothetical protein